MRAARARVHGGMGGVALRGEEWGAVAALLGRVDDFAAVRGIVAAAAWQRGSVAWAYAEPVRRRRASLPLRHGWSRGYLAA